MGISDAATPGAMAFYCMIWGVFTTGMFIATLKKAPRAL
jgi:succinate-acetate transporter protein